MFCAGPIGDDKENEQTAAAAPRARGRRCFRDDFPPDDWPVESGNAVWIDCALTSSIRAAENLQ
jgi:hypothetical protein